MKLTKSKLVMIAAAALGVLAILLLLAPGVSVKTVGGSLVKPEITWKGVSGFKVAFAAEDGAKFSFVLFLPFLLTIVGIALTVTSLFVDNTILKVVAAAVFVVAGVFFFMYLTFYPTLVENSQAKKIIEEAIKNKDIKLGVGAIMAGIFSILAGAATCVGTFVIKK